MTCSVGAKGYLSKWNRWPRDHSHRYGIEFLPPFCLLDICIVTQTVRLQVLVDIESREMLEISSAVENISNVQKKRKKV